MRNILALVGAAVVAFLAVGWYLGWYQVSSPSTAPGKPGVHVDINSEKISEDVKKGVTKGEEIVETLRDKSAEAKPGQPATTATTPGSGR
jgi:hypothetical protein